jgi:hypothetical protein
MDSHPGEPAVLPCPTELTTLAPPPALLETKRGRPAAAEHAPPRFALFFPLDEPLETSVLAPMFALPGNGGMGNLKGFPFLLLEQSGRGKNGKTRW